MADRLTRRRFITDVAYVAGGALVAALLVSGFHAGQDRPTCVLTPEHCLATPEQCADKPTPSCPEFRHPDPQQRISRPMPGEPMPNLPQEVPTPVVRRHAMPGEEMPSPVRPLPPSSQVNDVPYSYPGGAPVSQLPRHK